MGNDGSKQKTFGSGPTSSTVQNHMENAKKSRILQLKNYGMKKVPDSLNELSEVIRNLDLSQNKIQSLPSFIGKFTQLKQLHLADNILSFLPDEIGCVKTLEVLNLQKNKLTTLPSTLAACISLKSVDLSSNSFPSFPSVVCHLIELETLNLSSNAITEFNDEIATCRAIEINVNLNRLASIRAASLAKCPRLKILRMEENCLEKKEFTQDLLENSTISIIAYSGNMFQDKEFQGLDGYEAYQERFTATRRKI